MSPADFSAACVSETGVDPTALAAYATRQVVEDLDVFRRWLGVETLHLYGESYGTQYVQTYAAAHPDQVAALLVDGPVDLTLDGIRLRRGGRARLRRRSRPRP